MKTLEQRFWEKVLIAPPHRCWEWLGAKNHKGYGRLYCSPKLRAAHRVAYELFYGAIPNDLPLDHLCRNRACVNPHHLEPVTTKENLKRGIQPSRTKTHCIRGHPFTPENTRITPQGHKSCRACNRFHKRKKAQCLRRSSNLSGSDIFASRVWDSETSQAYTGVVQSVERAPVKGVVAGSSPAPGVDSGSAPGATEWGAPPTGRGVLVRRLHVEARRFNSVGVRLWLPAASRSHDAESRHGSPHCPRPSVRYRRAGGFLRAN